MAARKRPGLMKRLSMAVISSPEPEVELDNDSLTPEERKQRIGEEAEKDIEEMFECFDTDSSNALDAEEFGDALSMLSIHLEARGLRELFDEIDTSKSGDLQLDEWTTMMTRSKKLLLGKSGPQITPTEVHNTVMNVSTRAIFATA